ncbi:MAG: potassium transporter Kup [Acidobacteriota bacterium]|nr:potassium transporter Kup [Acidobacteriota bacterium]
MSLGALGIVYGDIGTSPLYAMRECFSGTHPIAPTPTNVLGVLSLIFWALVVVISIKYLVFVLRADNRGEGGILALMALARPRSEGVRGARWLLIGIGIFGAALLYGDGVITPAISVLSAVEGITLAAPGFSGAVLPTTIVILFALFFFQKRGTGGLGVIFGPVMFLWFITLAVLGVSHIVREPHVFAAINPLRAVDFFVTNRWQGFLTLGTVFLVVTGGEALYADLGHFGKRPIRLAWFAMVLPALLLNYFGQGALLLHTPEAAPTLFYRMAPGWALYPLVGLATAATVIASQALISGVFSLTSQAVQLGYIPRLKIEHTSARERGQIYIPAVNWALMVACIALVAGFQTSSNMAAAYGIAVTATMVITTLLLFAVERKLWGWPLAGALVFSGLFLIVDLAFFGANIVKVAHGGWFPLVVALFVFTLMTTWQRGRQILYDRIQESALSDSKFLVSIGRHCPPRVSGTAVFMDRTIEGIPLTLLHNLKHNKVLHERVLILTIVTEEVPYVSDESVAEVRDLGQGVCRVVARYGFMENPDVPELLKGLELPGARFDLDSTTFFLGRETLLATHRPGMALWRERFFAWMMRNAQGAALFFRLPPNRVVEIGAQIEL